MLVEMKRFFSNIKYMLFIYKNNLLENKIKAIKYIYN